MRANAILFWILAVFFLLSAIVYTLWNLVDPMHGKVEPVGTVGLLLSTILAAFIAFYIGRSHSSQGGELPEDRLDANIDGGGVPRGRPHADESGREGRIEGQGSSDVLVLEEGEQGLRRGDDGVGLVGWNVQHVSVVSELGEVVRSGHDDDQDTVRAEHPVELREVARSEDVEDGVDRPRTNGQGAPRVRHEALDPR